MHILLYMFLIVFILLLGVGTYLTLVAYKKPVSGPKYLTDRVQTLKWMGPLTIVVGLVGGCLMLSSIMKISHSDPSAKHASNFGFRFF